jgi:cytoskeletal protein RodZ
MTSVGAYLHELRERRGVPLGDIARTTRVAQRYLEALESDAFEALPPPVFTRGYIRAYCQALMEPPEEALARYDVRDGRPPQAPARPLVTATRTGGAEPRTRGAVIASLVLLVVLGMALFTVALVIQPRERGESAARPTPAVVPAPLTPPEPSASQPTPPAAVTSPAPAPSNPRTVAAPPPPTTAPSRPAETMPPVPSTPAPRTAPIPATAPATPPGPSVGMVAGGIVSPYRLVARTSEATWIRVRTEDGRISEENVPAGEVREWISDRPFELMIGNAGGVILELNGRALPPLGGRGIVVPRLVLPPPR